jgi:hypothetical protein
MTSERDAVRAAFVAEVISSFRRYGETGTIELEEIETGQPVRPLVFSLVLHGPPWRRRWLTPLYAQWLRTQESDRAALIDAFGAKRFGHMVTTANPALLTDVDIDHSAVHCCGDEDLVFIRCPACGAIWIECYECDTWHTNLNGDASAVGAHDENEARCPECAESMRGWWSQDRDAFLPTREQVEQRGLARFLSPKR